MKIHKRHTIIFTVLRPIFRLFLKLRYNFTADRYNSAGGPYLILPNHTCNLDPFMVSMSFNKPIYFVASDHLFRLGFISKIIDYLVAPIPKLKSSSDVITIKKIMSTLKQGGNICIFPEGNRTFNGCTGYISPAIGKLIQISGVPVLLYCTDKGYLAEPRWGDTIRKGKLKGYVKQVLTPDIYGKMTAQEITGKVIQELYVDPLPLDIRNETIFRGKNLAEHLERCVVVCPVCHTIASIHTIGNYGKCDVCGMNFEYLPTGYLQGEKLPFVTVKQWDDWQRTYISELQMSDEQLICSDENERIYSILRAKKSKCLGEGTISLYANRIEFIYYNSIGPLTLYFEQIDSIIVIGRQRIQIGLTDKTIYELKNKSPRSALKYMYFFYSYKNKLKTNMIEYFGI